MAFSCNTNFNTAGALLKKILKASPEYIEHQNAHLEMYSNTSKYSLRIHPCTHHKSHKYIKTHTCHEYNEISTYHTYIHRITSPEYIEHRNAHLTHTTKYIKNEFD